MRLITGGANDTLETTLVDCAFGDGALPLLDAHVADGVWPAGDVLHYHPDCCPVCPHLPGAA